MVWPRVVTKQYNSRIVNALIEHSSNSNVVNIEAYTVSIMGSMKSIIGNNFR